MYTYSFSPVISCKYCRAAKAENNIGFDCWHDFCAPSPGNNKCPLTIDWGQHASIPAPADARLISNIIAPRWWHYCRFSFIIRSTPYDRWHYCDRRPQMPGLISWRMPFGFGYLGTPVSATHAQAAQAEPPSRRLSKACRQPLLCSSINTWLNTLASRINEK